MSVLSPKGVERLAKNYIKTEVEFKDLDISIFKSFPQLTVTLKDADVKATQPYEDENLISAKEITLGLDLTTVFNEKLVFNKLLINEAVIQLKVDSLGKNNYDILVPTEDTNQEDTKFGLALNNIDIDSSTFLYDDKLNETYLKFEGFEERRKMIEADPLNGTVICRCCTVTEGEIVEAIHQPVGAKTSDGVKRRTGAGMGRCQAGFCNPKVVEILARELDIPASEVLKSSDGSNFLV